jgi:hypothetical protein
LEITTKGRIRCFRGDFEKIRRFLVENRDFSTESPVFFNIFTVGKKRKRFPGDFKPKALLGGGFEQNLPAPAKNPIQCGAFQLQPLIMKAFDQHEIYFQVCNLRICICIF